MRYSTIGDTNITAQLIPSKILGKIDDITKREDDQFRRELARRKYFNQWTIRPVTASIPSDMKYHSGGFLEQITSAS